MGRGKLLGTTLIELVLVMALTSIIIGTLAGLFSFAIARANHAFANANSLYQARRLLDQVQAVVMNAQGCVALSSAGATGLKCVMPATGTDKDGDGYNDSYTPTGISRRGFLKWGVAKRIWFYTSDSSGAFGMPGTVIWRAQRTDDSLPTSSDADSSWSNYYGGKKQYSLITALQFSTTAAAHTVNVTIAANQLARSESSSSAASDSNSSYSLTLTRTICWRNWRQ
jgi:type II secretory pathway pseudopilin PulG